MKSNLRRWDELVGTFFGAGLSPVAPGTAGSMAAVALYALLGGTLGLWFWIPFVLALFFLGTLAADKMEQRHGKDPGRVVVDEVVGQVIALLGSPVHWADLLLAFALFRLFDILKPPPVRQAERLPGGLGIMFDDVVAGVIALALMWLARAAGILPLPV